MENYKDVSFEKSLELQKGIDAYVNIINVTNSSDIIDLTKDDIDNETNLMKVIRKRPVSIQIKKDATNNLITSHNFFEAGYNPPIYDPNLPSSSYQTYHNYKSSSSSSSSSSKKNVNNNHNNYEKKIKPNSNLDSTSILKRLEEEEKKAEKAIEKDWDFMKWDANKINDKFHIKEPKETDLLNNPLKRQRNDQTDEIIQKKQEINQAYIWQAQLDELKEKKLLARKGFRKEDDRSERNETFRNNNNQHGYRIESNHDEVCSDDDIDNMNNEYEYMDASNLDEGYSTHNKEFELEGSNIVPKAKSGVFDVHKFISSTATVNNKIDDIKVVNKKTISHSEYFDDDLNSQIQDSLSEVNIDSLFSKILDFKLQSLSDNFTPLNELKKVEVRFMHEESYINVFEPLLVEEVGAAIDSFIKTGIEYDKMKERNNRNYNYNNTDITSLSSSNINTILLKCIEVKSIKGLNSFHLDELKVSRVVVDEVIDNNLRKDDLVLILKKRMPIEGIKNIQDAINLPHHLAIVSNSMINSYNDDNNKGEYQSTLVMLQGKAPSIDSIRTCIPVMSLSTFIREWLSLHSIKSFRLMPLAPYLLKAAPVVSSIHLNNKNIELTNNLKSLLNLSTDSKHADLRKSAIFNTIEKILVSLDKVLVDGSVLLKTGIAKTVNNIAGSKFLTIKCNELAKYLKQKWISQIKIDNKGSTIRNLKGGRVVDIPLGAINIPNGLSIKLWKSMCDVYNSSQLMAIKYVCDQNTEDQDTRISLVQGPPGTGKTSTILGIISAFLFKANDKDKFGHLSTVADINRKHILLCAPSNAAVDELLNRLQNGVLNNDGVKQSINIVRLGVPLEGASMYIKELCLENKVEKALKLDAIWTKLQYIKQAILSLQNDIRQQSNYTSLNNQVSDNNIRKMKNNLNDLYKTRNAYELGIEKQRGQLRRQIINEADIVAATLSGSGNKQFFDHILKTNHLSFETCIIDEAAQTTEPSTLIPLRYGCKRLVLVGDTRQLPATVLSINADKAGLSQSLFERLEKANHEVVMLSIQYRMHPDIRLFPSNYFYQGKLIDAPYITREIQEYNTNYEEYQNVKHTIIPDFIKNSKLNSLNFFDLNSYEEKKFKSFINETEIQFIISLLNDMKLHITDATIAIITPYKAQVTRLRELLKNNSLYNRLDINTIDGFQGREMDIVLFSCVRTSNSIGFVADERRMNVAITRAKKCLIIIGQTDSLSNNEAWKMMIESIKERNMITKVSLPYSLNLFNKD